MSGQMRTRKDGQSLLMTGAHRTCDRLCFVVAFPLDRFSGDLKQVAHGQLVESHNVLAKSAFPEEASSPPGLFL